MSSDSSDDEQIKKKNEARKIRRLKDNFLKEHGDFFTHPEIEFVLGKTKKNRNYSHILLMFELQIN